MSLVISRSYVVTDTVSGGGTITGNNPVIGWRNLATPQSITTDTAAAGFSAANMGNPSTNLRWLGVASPLADEHVAVALTGEEDVDYIAIARHNLASAQIGVGVDYLDTAASPASWAELIAPVLLPNDGPALFRFPPFPYAAIRLRLAPGAAAPTIAVVYAGKLLILQRRIYVGHTPMPYGRMTKVTNARSESGNFLGRIVLNQMTQTQLSLENLTPGWYRSEMEPFLKAACERPFFFAWRPSDYPHEVGFAWLTNDPQPANQRANGMMQVELQMAGTV